MYFIFSNSRSQVSYSHVSFPSLHHRVNGIGGHSTCYACALKSHILQNELTGHTTCKTCAHVVTKRFIVWFLTKTDHQSRVNFCKKTPKCRL
jgi:hypothetical protein